MTFPSPPSGAPHVLFLCTGNAARSVMGGIILAELAPHVRISTAGTHVIEGHPMSWRTRDAIVAVGFTPGPHRSRQLTEALLDGVDLIVAAAGEHVSYIRRRHPRAAPRTATLKRLVRDLGPGSVEDLPARVASLGLGAVELEGWEDVVDPAGGDLEEFVGCAREIHDLLERLVPLLG